MPVHRLSRNPHQILAELDWAGRSWPVDSRWGRWAVASFAGSTGGGYAHAAGRSSIWTSGGVVAAQAGPETGAIARAKLED
jgi:hypothetical protein